MMSCKLSYKVEKDLTLISLKGNLTQFNKISLTDAVNKIITTCPINIQLDMSNIGYIDSSGLGELLALHSMIYKLGGSFTIINPSQSCNSILNLIFKNIVRIKNVS
ncbi:STAS domain-containing protein [Spartinivicinus ruber]|uniref:STAS domain-containing protein n=1 Tax=Spartinivicinus ruber TaxID=2683272 RepID=UPI0013D3F5E6|nr:STAS domain-containing protein [Spartinivicinus ruber]